MLTKIFSFITSLLLAKSIFACDKVFLDHITKVCGTSSSTFVLEVVIPKGKRRPFTVDIQPPDDTNLGFKTCVVLNTTKYEFPENTPDCKQKFPF